MAYSKENYSKDLRSEKVNLMQSPGLRCTKLNYLLDTHLRKKERKTTTKNNFHNVQTQTKSWERTKTLHMRLSYSLYSN